MGKRRTKKIADELKKQDEEVYGDETISGSSPTPQSDDDVEEIVKDAFGGDAEEEIEEHDTFTLGDEVEKDEEKRR